MYAKSTIRLCAAIAGLALSSIATAQQTSDSSLPAYVLQDTEVLKTPAPSLGREYEAYVALPKGYSSSTRRYPVVYVTDAGYAFPLIRSIAARVRDHGVGLEDFILVGLSYAKGESGVVSRNRDYTPSDRASKSGAGMPPKTAAYGQADAYLGFLRNEVLPIVEKRYRVDSSRRIYVGHSYGSLLGIHTLLTQPTLFSHYVLGSPSLWYDEHQAFRAEQGYATNHTTMPAKVRFFIGGYERLKKGYPRYNTERDMVPDLERFVGQMRLHKYQGLDLKSAVLENEDHATVFPALVTRGLMWALPSVSDRIK